ncbi:hypothetical protein [Phenylobacterium sp.]|uniref:hypothetical protein n=1 Tax=Phenylobacterium sp. TaxID=1871053 RepID=UPI00289E3E47|nr:hypothetical protein [Phenylobacterium sp.]
MMHPPSLPDEVKARAFLATNGELGICLADVRSFLNACRADRVEVFGWELWVVNHTWGAENDPIPAGGLWCGGIPLRDQAIPAVVGGSGDLAETERQLASFSVTDEVQRDWISHVRVNFTLAE